MANTVQKDYTYEKQNMEKVWLLCGSKNMGEVGKRSVKQEHTPIPINLPKPLHKVQMTSCIGTGQGICVVMHNNQNIQRQRKYK